jgi:hypothetical protein
MPSILKHAVLLGTLAAAGTAHAGLLGESINAQLDYLSVPIPQLLLNQTATIADPTVEFSYGGMLGTIASADITDNKISLNFYTGVSNTIGADLVWTFTLQNPNLVFASITEDSDNFLNGASLISYSGNTASFRILNQDHNGDQTFSAVYSVTDASAPVPEIDALAGSGALTLLGFGLALAGERRRRAA